MTSDPIKPEEPVTRHTLLMVAVVESLYFGDYSSPDKGAIKRNLEPIRKWQLAYMLNFCHSFHRFVVVDATAADDSFPEAGSLKEGVGHLRSTLA